VADINPEVKRALHAALVASGKTLKEWLVERALAEIEQHANARASVAYQTVGRSREAPLFGEAAVTTIGGTAHASEAVDAVKPPRPEERRSVVSMFSGCGGMDLGFLGGFRSLEVEYPRSSFDIIWANDFNLKACDTYRHNIGSHIVPGDVWEAMETMPETADVVIGGFPCQDISVNGKGAGINGKRSGLYRAMVLAVEKLRPKVFVAENVKGLLTRMHAESLATVLRDFSELGYAVTYDLYQAADYGVPQTRERVFIVGVKGGGAKFTPPAPTTPRSRWVDAVTAIADLASHPESPEFSHTWSRANRSPEQGDRRLKADRPGYTIRAECHGNIQYHYDLPRRISMREAARFQSFPDDFQFQGKLRETERMVGNAVPPVLAWHVAQQVERLLGTIESTSPAVSPETARRTAPSPSPAHQPA